MFNNPFSFKGRIARTEYVIGLFIWVVACGYLVRAGEISKHDVLDTILLLIMFWFILAHNTKRAHDLGHSGWFMFIPFYGLVLMFGEGARAANEYGPNPKEPVKKDENTFTNNQQ